jgi:predicted DNA binding protein
LRGRQASDARCRNFAGGLLIGRFEKADRATRKVLTVMLAEDKRIKREALAEAFGISDSTLRYLVRTRERGGFDAVAERKDGSGDSTVTPAARRKLEALCRCVGDGGTCDLVGSATAVPTVGLVRREWGERRRLELEAASASPDISRSRTRAR